MNPYVTGDAIKTLREKNRFTQSELAEKLNVSDKAVSKWETGKGYPDITLLEPLAKALQVSITELMSGSTVTNSNTASNMLRAKFYVCPVCGNVIYAGGEAVLHCHGVLLKPSEPEQADERHSISVTEVEDEYYVRINHEMTKQHHISFIAAISQNGVQLVKLYPEAAPEARFKRSGVERICYYCNRDGFYCEDLR